MQSILLKALQKVLRVQLLMVEKTTRQRQTVLKKKKKVSKKLWFKVTAFTLKPHPAHLRHIMASTLFLVCSLRDFKPKQDR